MSSPKLSDPSYTCAPRMPLRMPCARVSTHTHTHVRALPCPSPAYVRAHIRLWYAAKMDFFSESSRVSRNVQCSGIDEAVLARTVPATSFPTVPWHAPDERPCARLRARLTRTRPARRCSACTRCPCGTWQIPCCTCACVRECARACVCE